MIPLSTHAMSKLGGDHYCHTFYRSFGLRIASIPYSNVCGPGQRRDSSYCRIVSEVPLTAQEGTPLSIDRDGEHSRYCTHIDDAKWYVEWLAARPAEQVETPSDAAASTEVAR